MMVDRWRRLQIAVALYALTAVGWLAQYPLNRGEMETVDVVFSGLALGFAGGAALLVFSLDLPVLEVGWGVFTYSYFLRLLDAIAEGPESLEAILPGTIRLVGLAIILLGFARATQQLRSNLEQRNERLTVLNRVLRHNVRNNLTAIISSLRHYRDNAPSAAEAEYARLGLEKAWELSELSEKARTIDSTLEGTEEGPEERYDLARIVESQVDTYRRAYPGVDIDLTVVETPDINAIDGVEAAVANVIENACEHNDVQEPTVSVTVDVVGSMGVVTVHDNGPGIPSNELSPIREGKETALDHGSGVGLWFVFWVVERSGGEIDFEYSQGQKVTLRFDLADSGLATADFAPGEVLS